MVASLLPEQSGWPMDSGSNDPLVKHLFHLFSTLGRRQMVHVEVVVSLEGCLLCLSNVPPHFITVEGEEVCKFYHQLYSFSDSSGCKIFVTKVNAKASICFSSHPPQPSPSTIAATDGTCRVDSSDSSPFNHLSHLQFP